MPSLSGVSDMDYPLQGPGLLSVPNLPELSAVRRVPLPPELVEQFSRILLNFSNNSSNALTLRFHQMYIGDAKMITHILVVGLLFL